MPQSGRMASARLLNLLQFLIAQPQGAMRLEILASVPEYAQKMQHSPAAAIKQFERDRLSLAQAGVNLKHTIVRIPSINNANGKQDTKYWLDTAEVFLPAEFEFSAAECAVLFAAANYWSGANRSAQTYSAVLKLLAMQAQTFWDALQIDAPVQLLNSEDALVVAEIFNALVHKKRLQFSYARANGKERNREVTALTVYLHENRWHLFAFDHDLQDVRIFLLQRINMPVCLDTAASSVSESVLSAKISELEQFTAANECIIEVYTDKALRELFAWGASPIQEAADSVAESTTVYPTTATVSPQLPQRVIINTSDLLEFAAQLFVLGADIKVLSPQTLLKTHRDILNTVYLQHKGALASLKSAHLHAEITALGDINNAVLLGAAIDILKVRGHRIYEADSKLSVTAQLLLAFAVAQLLLANKNMSLVELSKRLRVSEKTLITAIGALNEAWRSGVIGAHKDAAIEVMQIDENGHQNAEAVLTGADDSLPVLTFTDSELVLLSFSLKLIKPILSGDLGGVIDSCEQKIWQLRKPADSRKMLDSIDTVAQNCADNNFQTLATAVFAHQAAQFSYSDVNGVVSTRTVVPIALKQYRDDWQLLALCLERKALRHFKVSAITQLQVLEREKALNVAHMSADEFMVTAEEKILFAENNKLHSKNILEFVADTRVIARLKAFTPEFVADKLLVQQTAVHDLVYGKINVWNTRVGLQLIAAAAGSLRILKPENIKNSVQNEAFAALKRYEQERDI